MTGIAKPHVSRAVNDLIAAGVVRRSAGTFGNSLSINKRYKQWALGGAGHVVTGFSARQWAVVMAVVRKTYGYGKRLTTSAWGNSHL